MEALEWCNDFMNEICNITHFLMKEDEIIDLSPPTPPRLQSVSKASRLPAVGRGGMVYDSPSDSESVTEKGVPDDYGILLDSC